MGKKTDEGTLLITRFSALGDVALALPVIYDACRENPGRKFLLLTRKLPAKLFVNPPANLTVLGIDTSLYKGVKGIYRLFSSLRKEHGITGMVDLHDVIRTKLLRLFARMAGMPVAHIDKGRKEKRALTGKAPKQIKELKHSTERYRDAFMRAGISAPSRFSTIFADKAPDPSLFAKATPDHRPGERWIAIAPFAAHKGKIYPEDLLQEVVDHYAALPETKIFIFGAGDSERQTIDKLAKGRENVINMAEKKIGMEGELALMSRCDVMLAMDSANMHMASLAGLRTVSVWGATHPCAGFYGLGQDREDAVQLDLECRPCSVFGNKPCARGDYHCLRGINPQQIISRMDAKSNIRGNNRVE